MLRGVGPASVFGFSAEAREQVRDGGEQLLLAVQLVPGDRGVPVGVGDDLDARADARPLELALYAAERGRANAVEQVESDREANVDNGARWGTGRPSHRVGDAVGTPSVPVLVFTLASPSVSDVRRPLCSTIDVLGHLGGTGAHAMDRRQELSAIDILILSEWSEAQAQ
jgi:hypothetical protein